MDDCNDYFTEFTKEFNLFSRYHLDKEKITDLDIVLTKIYIITMIIMPIYIIIYKIDHYNSDKIYCDTHKNVHSCRKVTFPYCIIEIIINIFSLKLFIQALLTNITNISGFFYSNGNKVIDYIDDISETNPNITTIQVNKTAENCPNKITKININHNSN